MNIKKNNKGGRSLSLRTQKIVSYPLCGDTPQRPVVLGRCLQRPVVFCLTGQMAAGKNYVCSLIESSNKNIVSIDLDKTVHKAIELSAPEILKAFDEKARKEGIILQNSDGSLNRRALGAYLFPRPQMLARQESIVYPKTIELTKDFIEENSKKGNSVIINATVLFKTPQLLQLCDRIIFVKACFFKRLLRARKRDGLPFRQILRRFWSQRDLLNQYKKSGKEIIFVKN